MLTPITTNNNETPISNNIWKTLVYAIAFNPPAAAKKPDSMTIIITERYIGKSNNCFTKTPPANKVKDNHEIKIVIKVYHAKMFRVESPKRFPINSGKVSTLAPKYLGEKWTAKSRIKMKAYHAKLPATIPVVKPTLAEAISIEGPTLVPHIFKPILPHPKVFPARKILSSSDFLFFTKEI